MRLLRRFSLCFNAHTSADGTAVERGESGVREGAVLSYCAGEARRNDPDRFLCALFAPEDRREDLMALLAFNLEIARAREQVSEAMLGRIRLQWWRDALAEIYAGAPRAGAALLYSNGPGGSTPGPAPRRHAVIEPLAAAVARHGLDRAMFERMIDAREADMESAPPRDLKALMDYAEGTAGGLAALSLAVLGVTSEAAGDAAQDVAVAWALIGLLRATAFHARAKRQYLPLELMEKHGASQRDLFELRAHAGLSAVARDVAAAARERLAKARAARRGVPPAALPVLLPAVLAGRYLKTLERLSFDPLSPAIAGRDRFAAWRVTAAALLGRY
jgi:phytoene synthase